MIFDGEFIFSVKDIAVLQGRECPSIDNCTAPAADACPPCNYASKGTLWYCCFGV